MLSRLAKRFTLFLAAPLAAFSSAAHADVTVMMSGGFANAYRLLLPEFERKSGVKVVTTSGASQGTGPSTIRSQIEKGARPDVVILSREGLGELISAGRIVEGSDVGLATAPLGAAVRIGSPKPDVGALPALKETLLKARLISMPGSTSGIFIRDVVLPKLGIADKVSVKVTPRGTDSTSMLAAGESDIALGPVSELVGQPGVEYVGAFPEDVQLVQEFTAAIVQGSSNAEDAKKLIAFMSSSEAAAAIEKTGMAQASGQKPR